MFLQITDISGTVRHIDLGTREGEWLLGRSDTCDICLSESSVSRKHAKIFGGPETFFITDLGSGIGTKPLRSMTCCLPAEAEHAALSASWPPYGLMPGRGNRHAGPPAGFRRCFGQYGEGAPFAELHAVGIVVFPV